MDFSSRLTYAEIEYLKCSICSNYLSHFPIHTSPSDQSVCGRCPPPSESYTRNKIYETISQNLWFPCRYRSDGCGETLLPKEVPQHEEQCSYRIGECPTKEFTACATKTYNINMIEHCREQHQEYFSTNANFEFEIDTTKSQQYDHLFERGDELFVVRGQFVRKDNIFLLTLPRNAHCKLKFRCRDKHLSVKCDGEKKDLIFLESLITPNESKIYGKICVRTKTEAAMTAEDINRELLSLWECSLCSKYVLRLNFSSNNSMCPKCHQRLNGGEIFFKRIHEIITTFVTFPCENSEKGCNFAGQFPHLQNHLERCQFSLEGCPLEDYADCNWRGLRRNFKSHLNEVHNPVSVTSAFSTESSVNLQVNYCADCDSPKIVKFHILRHFDYYFHFVCVQKGQQLCFLMQMMGEFNDIFGYEIVFYDDFSTVTKVAVSQSCYKHKSKIELFDNLPTYHYVSLRKLKKMFYISGSIAFKIRIFKK